MADLLRLFQQGKFLEITKTYVPDVVISNLNWQKNFLIGKSFLYTDQIPEALKIFLTLETVVKNDEIYSFIGQCFSKLNKTNEAINYFNKAISLKSNNPNYFNELGNLYLKKLDLGLSVQNYQEALKFKLPDKNQSIIYLNIGLAYYRFGQIDEAIASYEKSLKLYNKLPNLWLNIGLCYLVLKNFQKSVYYFNKAIELNENYFQAFSLLGSALMGLGNYFEAYNSVQKSVELNAQYAPAWINLAKCQMIFRQYQSALNSYNQAINIDPSNLQSVSNYLYCLNYLTDKNDNDICIEHQKFSKFFYIQDQTINNTQLSQKHTKIKIGFVSADFKNHSIMYFFKSYVENFDKSKFEVYCLSNSSYSDEQTEFLKKNLNFIEIHALDDESIVKLIQFNGIKILVDLSGHTAGNRLSLFAKKPCPIQISWIGYPNTTGLKDINFRIVDHFTDPLGSLECIEKKIRLPKFFMAYTPPLDYEVKDPPSIKNGYITFGSFNNIYKLNNEVIYVWSQILLSNPQNRLILKYHGFNDHKVRENVEIEFSKNGIPNKQLLFYGKQERDSHFLMYNQIDIALDTFPYNGTTTTCEALWMSTPVIALEGNDHRSRVSHSILNNIQASELSVKNKKNYIELAISLSQNLLLLAKYKKSLREQMLKSPLVNGIDFTKEFEKALISLLAQ